MLRKMTWSFKYSFDASFGFDAGDSKYRTMAADFF